MIGISRPRRERNNNASLETVSDTISLFPLAEREKRCRASKERKTLTRLPRERLFFCVVRYAVFGRRIDFPRQPGHRCASRFSLPDGRNKRGAASKFARFIRHRRRFAHFHWASPAVCRKGVCTSFGEEKGGLFCARTTNKPRGRHYRAKKGRAAGRRRIVPSIRRPKTASRTTEGIFKI